jgi:hypothetical protein
MEGGQEPFGCPWLYAGRFNGRNSQGAFVAGIFRRTVRRTLANVSRLFATAWDPRVSVCSDRFEPWWCTPAPFDCIPSAAAAGGNTGCDRVGCSVLPSNTAAILTLESDLSPECCPFVGGVMEAAGRYELLVQRRSSGRPTVWGKDRQVVWIEGRERGTPRILIGSGGSLLGSRRGVWNCVVACGSGPLRPATARWWVWAARQ